MLENRSNYIDKIHGKSKIFQLQVNDIAQRVALHSMNFLVFVYIIFNVSNEWKSEMRLKRTVKFVDILMLLIHTNYIPLNCWFWVFNGNHSIFILILFHTISHNLSNQYLCNSDFSFVHQIRNISCRHVSQIHFNVWNVLCDYTKSKQSQSNEIVCKK